jgi:hypothetical protein
LPQVGATLAKGEKSLEFELDGQRVEFRLVEQYTRSEVVEPGKVYQYWERPAIKFTFTGKFAFEITSYFEGRKRWADGKKQQLRDKLGEFLLCLVDAAKTLKQMKIDNEARQRRWAEEAQRRAEIERESKARADFKAKLLAEAAAARERDLLLDYLGRVKSDLGVDVGELEQPARDWLALAEQLANQVNPLKLRVDHLRAGEQPEAYYGYFGRTFV